MAKKVFLSFDYEQDQAHYEVVRALKEKTGAELEIDELPAEERRQADVAQLKERLAEKIGNASHLLVIVGRQSERYDEQHTAIGSRNWQWWEIETAEEKGKKLVAAKIHPSHQTPDALIGVDVTWAEQFDADSIVKAINQA